MEREYDYDQISGIPAHCSLSFGDIDNGDIDNGDDYFDAELVENRNKIKRKINRKDGVWAMFHVELYGIDDLDDIKLIVEFKDFNGQKYQNKFTGININDNIFDLKVMVGVSIYQMSFALISNKQTYKISNIFVEYFKFPIIYRSDDENDTLRVSSNRKYTINMYQLDEKLCQKPNDTLENRISKLKNF